MAAMESVPIARPGQVIGWVTLLIAVTALALATAAFAVSLTAAGTGGGMMGRGGTMGSAGMMGGSSAAGIQPGATGLVAGTTAYPRAIRIAAGPDLAFSPSVLSVVEGETVTFIVTTIGPTTHGFMVGPADAVAADSPGTPEIADIGMMQTKTVTVTFDGAGPYAFACHATGHYEAGMRGTITVLPR